MSVNGTASIFSNSDDPLEFRSHFTDLSSKLQSITRMKWTFCFTCSPLHLDSLELWVWSSYHELIHHRSGITILLLSLVQTVSLGFFGYCIAMLHYCDVVPSFSNGPSGVVAMRRIRLWTARAAHIMTGELPYDSSYAINKSMSDIDLTSLQTWGTFFRPLLLPTTFMDWWSKASVPNLLLVAVPTDTRIYTNAFAMIILFIYTWKLLFGFKEWFLFSLGAHYSGRCCSATGRGGAESRKGDLKEVIGQGKLPSGILLLIGGSRIW